MATIWSVILNRIDGLSPVWKEWRISVLSESLGAESAGAIPMLGEDGKLDPSLLSGSPGSGLQLSTDGEVNTVQDVLNLKSGTNITLVSDDDGGVTIAATGDLSTAFQSISSGMNTTAAMVVGSGSTLHATGTGVINATEIGGIPITGTLTHAGQIPISQPGNESAVWADPLVQGLQGVGTSASTVNPVMVGGVSDGVLTNLSTDPNGVVYVSVVNSPIYPSTFKTGQITNAGGTLIWTPSVGKKFRLLKYIVEGTANLSQNNQGVLTVSFLDGTTAIPLAHDVFVGSTAMRNTAAYTSGWVDLGGTGLLSVAANNGLSVTLSAAVTSGNFRVTIAGTEE